MDDLSKLCQETSDRIMDIVDQLQPVGAPVVQQELAQRHGLEVELKQLVRYMEWLRSSFPRKLVHAGPDAWSVVDLG